MRYVVFDDDGTLTGSYLQNLRPEHAEHHLEVSEEIAAQWTRYRVNVGVLEMLEPPPPTPVVPESITRWQALTILNQSGLLDAVEAYIGSLTDRQAQIDFSAASIWRRDWSWLEDAATALGLTGEQVDQMFIAASAL